MYGGLKACWNIASIVLPEKALEPGVRFKGSLIDTWNIETTPVDHPHEAKPTGEAPGSVNDPAEASHRRCATPSEAQFRSVGAGFPLFLC